MISRTVLLALLVSLAAADVYMHNPRGSNNRLSADNDAVSNDNRLFDSQNNNQGGYIWGEPLGYYEGSELTIEWTAQHGCGTDNIDCQIILQYACTKPGVTDPIRDGTSEQTIPVDMATYNEQTVGAYTYGMHESYDYYMRCATRERNMGLFTADQDMSNRPTAIFTRQDNNGNRQGFECPEERDYYPYWASTIWRDIAILTSHKSDLCGWYKSESQNVKSRWECLYAPDGTYETATYLSGAGQPVPISDSVTCENLGGTMVEIPAWDIGKPDCIEAPYSRDNHLGNSEGGVTAHYNWTIPSLDDAGCDATGCVCVLRLRYNTSTSDFTGFDQVQYGDYETALDRAYNGDNSPIKQDPMVEVAGWNLTLTLNTDQYARTFQDRSHTFYIKEREARFTSKVFNLNVRGRRGNIVECYPSVEYDFVPTILRIPEYSFVHFQWTGTDSEPANQAGSGKDQTDRSNIVQIKDMGKNYPLTEAEIDDMGAYDVLFNDIDDRAYFASAGQDPINCLSYEALAARNNNNADDIEEDPQNCMYLNAGTPYFDGGVFQFGLRLGKDYYYMSTRNNNFTNRSQKAVITVETAIPDYAVGILVAVGCVGALAGVVGGSFYMSKVKPHSSFAGLWTKIAHLFGK